MAKPGPDMSSLISEHGHGKSGWEMLWNKQVTPWNLGKVAPPLSELLTELPQFKSTTFRHCLVPGCGEGYDTAWLGSRVGCDLSVGLDLSDLAIAKCREKQQPSQTVSFEVADFFEYQSTRGISKFDLVFDYTFLCALHPDMRDKWSRKMASLVKKDGVLVALMFPLDEFDGGPPFALSVATYHELLDENFELVYGPVETEKTVPQRKGRELVSAWRRK